MVKQHISKHDGSVEDYIESLPGLFFVYPNVADFRSRLHCFSSGLTDTA